MTFGDKLSKLRKDQNLTQEQFASLLGVSRQSVSKWESNTAYPETEKLIRISTILNCSLDYLLKDGAALVADESSTASAAPTQSPPNAARTVLLPMYGMLYNFERKSSRTIRGIPLYHINIGPGRVAHGIIAIGLVARGLISFGLISMGLLSFGVVSLGLLAIGTLALGLCSLGAISVGVLALGSVAFGIISFGACSIGISAGGAAAHGHIAASGDYAEAQIAIGRSEAYGSVYQWLGKPMHEDLTYIRQLVHDHTPPFLQWAAAIFNFFL